MRRMFERLVRELREGRGAVLCVVVQATGSVPRGKGTKMAVLEDGTVLGTTGGGIVERRSVDLAREALEGGRSFVRGFNLSNPEAAENGMVCGGQVEIRFERLVPSQRTLAVLEAALEGLGARRRGRLLLDLDAEESAPNYWDAAGGLLYPDARLEGETARFAEETGPALAGREGARIFADPLEIPIRLSIFGGGHVARALAPLLARAGFSVTVLDDRSHFASPEAFPDAARTLTVDFKNLQGVLDLGPGDYAVVMTRGHLADLDVLAQILRLPLGYLGVIGSRKKMLAARARLLEKGFSEEEIARIHGPIGLAIGAETPFEIAVSITAEIIAVRAGAGTGLGMGIL